MLYDLFREAAAAFPANPALVEGGRTATYAELLEAVHAEQRWLAAQGVKAGDTVAVQIPNSIESAVALLAASGLGCTVLPLDPALTADEVARYAARSGASLAVRTGRDAARLTPDTSADALTPTLSPRERGQEAEGERNAVLLLSSGTAGPPKTVPKTGSQARAAIRIYRATVPYQPSDRVFGLLPFCHSFGLYNVLLATLASGAVLVLEPFSPRKTVAAIARERVTVLPATPLMFRLLAETPFRERPDVSSVRLAVSAGSALTIAVAQKFREAFGISILQSYGTTETGPIALARLDESGAEPVWLATRYEGVTIAIWDADGQPLAQGLEGEIAVRTAASTSGYLRNAEASASIVREEWRLTGDVGRLDEAGNLVIVGRRKPMLDVGGKKVAPAEVEACLRAHPAVADVVVVGRPAPGGGQRVEAHVVATREVGPLELQEFCAQRLADFKVPRQIHFVESLSRGVMGKAPTTLANPAKE